MSVDQRRLGFLTSAHDLDWISQQSGIGVQKLQSLAQEGKALGDQDTINLRRAYQYDVYHRAIDAGFSADQARRHRSFAPETVSDRISNVGEKIEYLAKGAYTAMSARLDRAGEDYDPEALYYEAENAVFEGFRHSKLSYEDWMEYAQ